jgi:hypothetical protein
MDGKWFTVVVLRPKYLEGSLDADDMSYTAHVEAQGMYAACEAARQQACDADRKDGVRSDEPDDGRDLDPAPDDYRVLVVFEGKHEPALFGFQAGANPVPVTPSRPMGL